MMNVVGNILLPSTGHSTLKNTTKTFRVRFLDKHEIETYHILANYNQEKFICADICSRSIKDLGADTVLNRKQRVTGFSTVGAALMVGKASGAVTWLECLTYPGVCCVWCGADEIDLAVKNDFVTTVRH